MIASLEEPDFVRLRHKFSPISSTLSLIFHDESDHMIGEPLYPKHPISDLLLLPFEHVGLLPVQLRMLSVEGHQLKEMNK
jgi:hypothetical protein